MTSPESNHPRNLEELSPAAHYQDKLNKLQQAETYGSDKPSDRWTKAEFSEEDLAELDQILSEIQDKELIADEQVLLRKFTREINEFRFKDELDEEDHTQIFNIVSEVISKLGA